MELNYDLIANLAVGYAVGALLLNILRVFLLYISGFSSVFLEFIKEEKKHRK